MSFMLLANIKDDNWYEVKSVPFWLKGTELKKPEVIRSIRELVRRCEEEAEYNRRCFPSRDNIQVFQMKDNSPAFHIHPNFDGVKQVLKDLGMPNGQDAAYFLRYFRGAEFIKYHKRSFIKFKKYAVEAFGIRIKLPADVDIFKLGRQPLPDATDYMYPPLYWYESPYHLIQIRRLRIFNCPLESIQVPISNPFNPNTPPIVKFEWRWHPQKYPEHFLYGPHNLLPRRPPKPFSFFKDCCRIIKDETRFGRPREITDRDFLIQIITGANRKWQKPNGKLPGQEIIAEECGVDRKTLYRYRKHFRLP